MPNAGAGKARVLFLCTGNSCRSQMAEGLLRSMAGERYESLSAGTDPHGLNPGAVTAMAELDIDISGQQSEHVDGYIGTDIDTVITVCDRAASNCPTFPGRVNRIQWSFDDPAQADGSEDECMQVFRRVRDEIAEALRRWLAEGVRP